MGKAARERQVIATWYEPKKKLPPTDQYVVITYSGEAGSRRFVNALGLGAYYPGEKWFIDELDMKIWVEREVSNHPNSCLFILQLALLGEVTYG